MKSPCGEFNKFYFTILVLGAMSAANAMGADAKYSYHPALTFALGKGVHTANPSSERLRCVNFKESAPYNDTAVETSVDFYLIRQTQDLHRVFNIDASANASVLMFKGNSKYDLQSHFNSKSSSVTLAIEGHSVFAPVVADNIEIQPRYQKMLDDGKMDDFESFCGSRFVSSEKRVVRVAVLVTIDDVSSDDRVKLTIDNGGGAGLGPISASAKVHVDALIQDRKTSRKVKFRVVATGGTGLDSLEKVIPAALTASDPLDSIRNELGSFIKTFSFKNAAPGEFETMGYPGFDVAKERLISKEKMKRLTKLVESYRMWDSVYQLMTNVTGNTASEEYKAVRKLFGATAISKAKDEMDSLNEFLENTANTHAEC
ncbi:MAG TPA: hypothetical protein PLH57_09040, partial [Oligoflexia bacterium]|nr:hypothetical protein [Oligoflexia bacterium]